MASHRALSSLATRQPAQRVSSIAASLVRTTPAHHRHSPRTAAPFSTTFLRAALPAGPPPAGYRLPAPQTWETGKETSLDKVGKSFLLLEILRGMWVVLEQFFRPP